MRINFVTIISSSKIVVWFYFKFSAHTLAIKKAEDIKKRKGFKELKEQMQEDLQVIVHVSFRWLSLHLLWIIKNQSNAFIF